jgi:hypothetical protein
MSTALATVVCIARAAVRFPTKRRPAGYLPWTIHPIVSVLRVCRDMAILLRLKRSFNSSDVAYGALPIEPLHPRIDSLTGSVHLARNLWGGLPGL